MTNHIDLINLSHATHTGAPIPAGWVVMDSRPFGVISTQLYQGPNGEVALAIKGSDDGVINDLVAVNHAFSAGSYPEDVQRLVEYAKGLNDQSEGGIIGDISVTGYSQGGGLSQLLSHTFGWNGNAQDAPGAGHIVDNASYKAQLEEWGVIPAGVPDGFMTVNERGSAISELGKQLGNQIEIDAIGGQGIYDLFASVGIVAGGPVGLAIAIASLVGKVPNQHSIAAMAEHINAMSEEEKTAFKEGMESKLRAIEEFNQTKAEALGSQLGSSFGRITYAFFGQEEGQTVLEEVIGESLSALISQNLFEFILTDADAFNDLLSNDLSAQLQSTISSRLTSELIAEIGIENGGSLPEAVALNVLNSVVNQGINYAIDAGISAIEGIWHSVEAAKQANDGAQAANTASDASNGSSITNAIGSAVGSWAAQQVLHTHTEAEAYGSALGSTAGQIVGAKIGGPVGAAIGAYIGAAAGDSIGEAWNYTSDKFDEGVGAKELWEIGTEWAINRPIDEVKAIFGMDEKPKDPFAEQQLEYNPSTGVYEVVGKHSAHGGKVDDLDGFSNGVIQQVDQLIAQLTSPDGQLANRHELPDIQIGYNGKHQYVKVDGVQVGGLDEGGFKEAVGSVLQQAVIEGGSEHGKHLLYSDGISATDVVELTNLSIQRERYDDNTQLKEEIDQLITDQKGQGEAGGIDLLARFDELTESKANLEHQISGLRSQLNRLESNYYGSPNSDHYDQDAAARNEAAKGSVRTQLNDFGNTLNTVNADLLVLRDDASIDQASKQVNLLTSLNQLLIPSIEEVIKDSVSHGLEEAEGSPLVAFEAKAFAQTNIKAYYDLQAGLVNADDSQRANREEALASFEEANPEMVALASLLDELSEAGLPDFKAQAMSSDQTRSVEQSLSDQLKIALETAQTDYVESGGELREAQHWDKVLTKTEPYAEILQASTPLDNAARLDYEIRNHNRTHEAEEGFNLYESDLSDLVFVTEGESLTIYNRRLDGADAPLASLPKIVLNDFGQWQDDGINLKFSNREGETVKLSFSIGGILSSFGLNGDGTVDVAQVLAEMHTERTGEPMSLEDAQALRFGHFGQMDAEGNWVGSGGDDLIHASAAAVDAGSGNDTITQSTQATHTDGGSGNDTISYNKSNEGVNVDLSAGTGTGGDAQGDTYANVENVIGSAHADTLVGNDADNVLNGGAGNDTLSGGGGADTLIGGEGVDTADYAASDKGVRVSLSQTVDGVEVAGLGRGGDAEGDRLSGIENAVGSAGDDVIHGNAGDNVLSGGAGNDTLSGVLEETYLTNLAQAA